MKYLAFLFLTALLSSCSGFEEDEIIYTMPVDSISVKSISNLTIAFTASNFCGSLCWERTYFEKRIKGTEIFIKTFAVETPSGVCPDVCVYTETPVIITLLFAGSYTFHFWKSDTSSIDTTLIVGL